MPQFVMFAPCDNVLVSGDHQSASLIVVLSMILFPGPVPPELKVGDSVGMRWFGFTQYEIVPEDAGKVFEQRLILRSGDGKEYAESILQLPIADTSKLFMRTIVANPAMPYLAPGIARFHIFLRESGATNWNEMGTYPIQIVHGELPT
jgi:hypothetical protein